MVKLQDVALTFSNGEYMALTIRLTEEESGYFDMIKIRTENDQLSPALLFGSGAYAG